MIETNDLVGKQFKYGGRGPEFYDCYGIILEGMRRLGVKEEDLPPDFESPSDLKIIAKLVGDLKKNIWRKQEDTEVGEGSVLLLKTNGMTTHVGFHLGGNYFLHAWEGDKMVMIERISFWQHKIEGFYEYTG